MDELCVLSEKQLWNVKNDCTACVESTSSIQLSVCNESTHERLVVNRGYKPWL